MLPAVKTLDAFFSNHPLTRDAPLRAWGRFVAWQVRSRLQEEVVFSWIEGQRLAVRKGMVGATGNIYVGLHEFADMIVPLHFLRADDLFLDIGSNVGSYTVLGSGVCRAKTWAFEPDPNTLRHLKRNIEINGLTDLVTVHECALGPVTGEVRFTVGLDTVNKVARDDDADVRIVRQRRLDDVVGGSRPVMIKMDVEGYEEDVLRGAEAVLAMPCLKVIELETVTPEIGRTLLRHGFEQVHYDPFVRKLSSEPVALNASNSLFVRDKRFVEDRLRSARKIAVLNHRI